MSFRPTLLAAVVLAGGVATAGAQVTGTLSTPTTGTTLTKASLLPLATASFAPASFGGTFNGSHLAIGLAWTSSTSPSAPVFLGRYKDSGIVVSTPQGIANGTYSVVFTIPWANAPATVGILRERNLVVQCALQQQLSYAAGSPIQRCDSGPIAVADGKLNLTLQFIDGAPSTQVNVSQITVNLFKY